MRFLHFADASVEITRRSRRCHSEPAARLRRRISATAQHDNVSGWDFSTSCVEGSLKSTTLFRRRAWQKQKLCEWFLLAKIWVQMSRQFRQAKRPFQWSKTKPFQDFRSKDKSPCWRKKLGKLSRLLSHVNIYLANEAPFLIRERKSFPRHRRKTHW